jgi:hypothetical protein
MKAKKLQKKLQKYVYKAAAVGVFIPYGYKLVKARRG